MHFAFHFLPIVYALGTVYLLQTCCPGASANYSWYNCGCPQAEFVWSQQRKQGRLCGYPALTSPASPPNFYDTLTWAGGMTQVVHYPVNNLSGETEGESETIFGVNIPANCDYTLVVNQFETWVNTVSGTDTFTTPEMSTEDNGETTTPCAETQSAVMSGYATLTTVVTGAYTPTEGPDAGDAVPVDSTSTAPLGPGAWSYAAYSSELLWGSLIDTTVVPFGGVPNITDDTTGGGIITGGIVSATKQSFIGSGTLTGEIDQTLSGEQDEATILGAQGHLDVKFVGTAMGGNGGWNAQSGASDYPSSVGGGGPGGGVDWCGPAWADREATGAGGTSVTGRQMDQISDAKFAILVTNLVAGVPMKCTVQAYRAAYSVDYGNPLTPTFGTPSSVGDPIVFTFTPTDTWYLIGATVPGGFDPTSFDPSTLTPTEPVISGAAPQGWIYGAKIVAVEPQ
jgi:hypothetical protein